MNTDTLLAKHVLGLLPVEALPGMALDAIQAGYDSPSLRQLAGASEHDTEEAHRLFGKAIQELGLPIPQAPEAGLTLARDIAREVVSGAIAPYEGAKRIWNQIYTRLPELKQLKPFVGLASEYEDDLDHRDDYSRRIIEKAQSLIDQGVNGK
jgi:hypothetical protein